MPIGRRVVLTGAGVVSSLGSTLSQFWQRLQDGKSGLSYQPGFFPSDIPSSTVGRAIDFDPLDFVPFERLLHLGRSTQMGIAAGLMALRDAELGTQLPADARVCMGTSFATTENLSLDSIWYGGGGERTEVPRYARDLSTELAQFLQARAASETIVQGCSASLTAIGHGVDWIRNGAAEVVLAGGTEAPLVPLIARQLAADRWLADDNGGLLRTLLRPFDQLRCGGVMAEGAGCVVLEEYEHAVRRGAPLLAEVVGWRATRYGDGTPGGPDVVEGQTRALQGVLRESGWESAAIDYVQLTGMGLEASDSAEVEAVTQALDPKTRRACVGTVTGALGHTFGASGVLQLIGVLLAMEHQSVPPIANHIAADRGCDLDFVALRARPWSVKQAMILSSGLGGCHTAMGMCWMGRRRGRVE